MKLEPVMGACPRCAHGGPHPIRRAPARAWKGWGAVVTCAGCGLQSEPLYYDAEGDEPFDAELWRESSSGSQET